MRKRILTVAISALATAASASSGPADGLSTDALTPVSRAQMIETAREMATHKWVCRPANRKAACSPTYRSRWKDDEPVVGVPYDWGGMDPIAVFDSKLLNGQAAGSHKEEGVTMCTTGVDCSGLVSLCWRQTQKFGTSTIGKIATQPAVNVFTELQPGDALNRAGSHIVIFASYHEDGTISVYEASGSASRVVLTRTSWARFKDYVPLRYRATIG
jgi:hypothetical protein